LRKGVSGCFGRHWLLKKSMDGTGRFIKKGKAMTSWAEPKAIFLTYLVKAHNTLYICV
jgi:hypothetical protein